MAQEWFDEYGNMICSIPVECVQDCYHSGDCLADVEAWQQQLNFSVPREKAVAWLLEYGAWELESDQYDIGLNDKTDEEIAQIVLWIACGDIQEDGEWFGLIH